MVDINFKNEYLIKKETIKENKVRHFCSCCNRKIYEKKMYRYFYPLLHRTAWHCEKCVKGQKWDLATPMSVPALDDKSKMST